MDESKQYIYMCEKAVEITSNRKWIDGDFGAYLVNNKASEDVYVIFGDRYYDAAEAGDDHLWLPRQDQIQDVMKEWVTNIWHISVGNSISKLLLKLFNEKVNPNTGTIVVMVKENIPFIYKNCFSMEQLWLTFAMKEKYNKQWNGEDWSVL